MSLIDTRAAVGLRQVCEVLLRIAENPLAFVEHVKENRLSMPNDDCIVASQLARQSSAAVISNCVVELWSRTVACLHSLEPDFPLYPSSVAKFVAETRLPFLSYVSLYYSLCGKPFEGTSSGEKVKTLVDLRHELQHDKPETHNDYSTERVDKVLKWKKRLEPLVGKEPLMWLPRVRVSTECVGFQLQGEPPVMKFMKYPVAKWAIQAIVEVTDEMTAMLFDYKGRKKLWVEKPVEEMVDGRFSSEKDLLQLWNAGE